MAHANWKDNEYGYCAHMIATKGNINVGRSPNVIASYLALQGNDALRDGEYEIAARLLSASVYVQRSEFDAAERVCP